jgi:Domain of unknown function (DUF6602)
MRGNTWVKKGIPSSSIGKVTQVSRVDNDYPSWEIEVTDLAQLMQARYRRLMLDFELTFSKEQVSHPGERGRLLEEILRTFLASVLPRRIGVGSGFIAEGASHRMSRQTDVILYDALNYPLILSEKSLQIYPNEAVLATIEVKSALHRKELTDGVRNILSSKTMHKYPPEHHPSTLGVLFCYNSWKRPKDRLKSFRIAAKRSDWQFPDLVCSLNPSFLFARTDTLGQSVLNMGILTDGMQQTQDKFPPEHYVLVEPLTESFREDVLLHFYLVLTDYLNRSLGLGVHMGQYTTSSVAWETHLVDLRDRDGLTAH